MRRREFIGLIGATAWPLTALAQPKPLPKVGIIGSVGGSVSVSFVEAMRELGLINGQTIVITGGGEAGAMRSDELARNAAELVAARVNVIFAAGSEATTFAKNATGTIPIVTISGDPIGLGFAESLARPGGNITGLSILATEVSGKKLELLKKVVPHLERVAIYFNPGDPGSRLSVKESETAAASLDLKLQILAITDEKEIVSAFAAASEGRAQAIALITNPLLDIKGQQIADLALTDKLPLIAFTESFPRKGALMSYGPSIPAIYRRAAYYVQRVLAGADPAELPIEQPTKFNLVLNIKTAKLLDLTIPDALLAQADEVIE